MSSVFRNGFDPQKADRGLRGIGLFVILIAFLIASNTFVKGGNKAQPTSTTPAKPPVVLADTALEGILGKVDAKPRFTYLTFGDASTATTPPPVDASDVVVTADTAAMTKLVRTRQCAEAVTIATDSEKKPPLVYQACAVMHDGQVRASAQAFIGDLTSLEGRVVLVDAGFDLPDRPGG